MKRRVMHASGGVIPVLLLECWLMVSPVRLSPEIQNLGMERESVQMASYRNGCCIAGKAWELRDLCVFIIAYILYGAINRE